MLIRWLTLQGSLLTRDVPSITTKKGKCREFHTPADRVSIKLLAVEAIDDSIIFGTSWQGLIRTVKLSEDFQKAYGIQTAWDSPDKTVCFTLGKPLAYNPETVNFSGHTTNHNVPFTEQPKLLRTALHDQQSTTDAILAIVEAFPIPIDRQWPISVLRRAVTSMLVSRIRPRLHLQPVSPKQANEIDHAISRKVTTALGLQHTSSALISLPVASHGFGFPSTQVLNGEIAVTMMLRSLNHHLTEIRTMAQITLANWQCLGNGCIPPLESSTLRSADDPRLTGFSQVPDGWITAVQYLNDADLPIVETDQSYLYHSSVEHLLTQVESQTGKAGPRQSYKRVSTVQNQKSAYTPVKEWLRDAQQYISSGTRSSLRIAAKQFIDWIKQHPFARRLRIYDTSVFTPLPSAEFRVFCSTSLLCYYQIPHPHLT